MKSEKGKNYVENITNEFLNNNFIYESLIE